MSEKRLTIQQAVKWVYTAECNENLNAFIDELIENKMEEDIKYRDLLKIRFDIIEDNDDNIYTEMVLYYDRLENDEEYATRLSKEKQREDREYEYYQKLKEKYKSKDK